jgi:hypothetical protein
MIIRVVRTFIGGDELYKDLSFSHMVTKDMRLLFEGASHLVDYVEQSEHKVGPGHLEPSLTAYCSIFDEADDADYENAVKAGWQPHQRYLTTGAHSG